LYRWAINVTATRWIIGIIAATKRWLHILDIPCQPFKRLGAQSMYDGKKSKKDRRKTLLFDQ
jgi:hypothetical protein